MARKGKNFELLIKKFETLKNIGAEIKSPESVLDVDTNTPREVDIGIRFKDSPLFIAFECRDRGSVQDIQWIEQLITKKKSINADILIAVTVSSFTKPAKIKACKNGIIIRNVENISAKDIMGLKGSSYIEVCYTSSINFLNTISLIDPKTKCQQTLDLILVKNALAYNKLTRELIPFKDEIQRSVIGFISKIPQDVFDKNNKFDEQYNLNFSHYSLEPYNYDIVSANISVYVKKEKIKYPLVSIKKYKASDNYDLLGEILEYGLASNNFIIDKPSNNSVWEIDWNVLEIPGKNIHSIISYNEIPTKLQGLAMKNSNQ